MFCLLPYNQHDFLRIYQKRVSIGETTVKSWEMPFALEQTTELETSIAPSILACCRDQEIRHLCRNLEDRKRSPGRRHLIPGFFVDPGQRDCNTDGGNFGEGHVDNLRSTWQRWSCLHYFFFSQQEWLSSRKILSLATTSSRCWLLELTPHQLWDLSSFSNDGCSIFKEPLKMEILSPSQQF